MKSEKLLSGFTTSQRIKLKIASFLYGTSMAIERRQFKSGKNAVYLRKTPVIPDQLDPKAKRKKYKIEKWSKHVPGINISTPWFIPPGHIPGIGYSARTVLNKILFQLGYSFKSNLSKEGLLSLKDSSSPFFDFKRDQIWISDDDYTIRALQGPGPQNIRKVNSQDWILHKVSKDDQIQLTRNEFHQILSDLYCIDYSIFDGLKTKEGFLEVTPQILFYQSSDGGLLKPIAISLSKEDPNVYTPLDSKEAWTYAKLATLQLEVLYMPLINHVVEAHLWMDPVIIATDFCLPEKHPVRSLISDHFKGNFAINKMAYFLLLRKNSFFDEISQFRYPEVHEIVRRGFEKFSLERRIVPLDNKIREIENIAYYPYRDDAGLVWDCLKKYVDSYLALYYDGNEDKDLFLAEWRASLKKELNLSDSLSLAEILTAILFNIYDHNIHQNSIQEYYLDPYQATALKGDLPKSKNEITEEYLYTALSDIKSKVGRGILIRAITDQTEIFSPVLFEDPVLSKINEEFLTSLKAAEQIMVERNKTRIKPFTSAYPSRIDNSIKI